MLMKAKTLLALAAGVVLVAPSVEARITRFVVDPALSQSPTFEGRMFGSVGAYEKLRGQAYSMAWNGWDPSAIAGADGTGLTISPPVAKHPDGTEITGPSYEYIVFDNATTTQSVLTYAAATTDKSKGTLTVRDHITDAPTVIPATGWEYTSAAGTAIRLLPPGTRSQQSA